MNFYTLTFRKKIIISFFFILGILILLDIGLYFVAQMKSTKTTFINDKFSKITHYKLNNPKEKDIVFIGSSRTFYHISTNTFKKNNLNIYNFGVSGTQFEDYPTFIPYVNSSNPKQIIISLSVPRLFNKLNIPKYPTLDEIEYYYDIDKIKFIQSLKQWIINRHLFLRHSEPIFYKIKSIYEKFDSSKKINKQKKESHTEILNGKKLFIDKTINYSTLVNCEVFNIKQVSNDKITLKCINGDGVLIGNHIKSNHINKKEFKILNKQSIQYLQKIIDNINTKKTKVSIILEPILHNPFTYNLNDIKKQFIDVEIIDLTNLKIEDDFWADNNHLNYKGREQYSQYLSDILK